MLRKWLFDNELHIFVGDKLLLKSLYRGERGRLRALRLGVIGIDDCKITGGLDVGLYYQVNPSHRVGITGRNKRSV